jgi:hypothetical protein
MPLGEAAFGVPRRVALGLPRARARARRNRRELSGLRSKDRAIWLIRIANATIPVRFWLRRE